MYCKLTYFVNYNITITSYYFKVMNFAITYGTNIKY